MHKIPLYFGKIAVFEADNEIEHSKSVCNKTANIFQRNPICNGCYIVSELIDVLQKGYQKSPGYDNIVWFVDEVISLEKKMTFYFKTTIKEIILTEEDDKNYRDNKYLSIP